MSPIMRVVPVESGCLIRKEWHSYIFATNRKPSNDGSLQVIGSLIDLDCSEDFIKTLLQNVEPSFRFHMNLQKVKKLEKFERGTFMK